ncbi:TrkA family potassium uptake protein [Ancylomarina sp. 16SWW S1-10-2]|uniref:potassium channel family protein n=1 Tax=Ancylomarina sp. 16SWW S1-10-2 TaxID=2499681 RepID=UPI0012AEA83B|nr:potassium channel protein [Ancylomarina sp. 16SWW S1-10-2]MRT94473.1 potassium channel protein [Ancylomarina sp. 16SWW S1-10-2]
MSLKGRRVWEGNIKALCLALLLLVIVIGLGTSGYMLLNEEYSFIDALYMTVITISTVGFKEVHDLSDQGKLFTILLILTSFGIFAYIASSVTRFILDGVFRKNLRDYRLAKKMEKLSNHVIVCGFGRNGRQAAMELIEHKEQVVVIDFKESSIEKVRLIPGLMFVHGDATLEEVLTFANIANAKALITAIPNDASNVYVCLTARELNPDIRIISRSSKLQSDNKLKRAGANNVIMPDLLGGRRMAKLVAQPDVVEFVDKILLQSVKGVNLKEVSCSQLASCFVGKSILDLNVRNISGANIIGLKDGDGNYIYNPSPNIILNNQFQLFVLGDDIQLRRIIELLNTGK